MQDLDVNSNGNGVYRMKEGTIMWMYLGDPEVYGNCVKKSSIHSSVFCILWML